MVIPLNDLILFLITNSTNKPISSGCGICFPGIVFACSSTVMFSFFKRFSNLFVLMGPGAMFIKHIFFFSYILLSDLNKFTKPALIELEIINSFPGCLIIYDDI